MISPASLLCPQGPTQTRGGLEGRGSACKLSRLPVPEWVGQSPFCSSPAPPRGPLLPASLVLPLASFLCPQGPTQPGGGFGGQGICLGAQQAPRAEWAGQSPSAPLPLFPESPSRLPLLISPASGVLILSGLHFSSPPSVPLHPTGSLWFTLGSVPSPWAPESPTSGRQAP